jgi:hypothetical protein
MADLLLHSMGDLAEIILPALEIAGAREIVEVGVEGGIMTRRLIDYAKGTGGSLTSIDPAPSAAAQSTFAKYRCARLIHGTSLEELPSLTADAYIIDGDHNYYTVRRESELAWEQFQRARKPFLAFYHDVGWPCARRDLYYAPERIPEEHRQPHAWDRGLTLGEPGTIEGGFRGEGVWACALKEGGARNGVLTAIEDFTEGRDADLAWARVPAVFGLGVLFSKRAPWSQMMMGLLLPYHEHPLLERLERNRLECYLNVLAWQDRENARKAA